MAKVNKLSVLKGLDFKLEKRLINQFVRQFSEIDPTLQYTTSFWEDFCVVCEGYDRCDWEFLQDQAKYMILNNLECWVADETLTAMDMALLWPLTGGYDRSWEESEEEPKWFEYSVHGIAEHLFEKLKDKAQRHTNKNIRMQLES